MLKKPDFTNYIVKVLAIALVAFAILEFLKHSGKIDLPLTFRLFPPVIFSTLSILLHSILLKSLDGRPTRFISIFMGTLGLKMLIHMSVMLSVAFLYPYLAVQFIMIYAVFYLAFTVFEVVSLMPLVNRNSTSPAKEI